MTDYEIEMMEIRLRYETHRLEKAKAQLEDAKFNLQVQRNIVKFLKRELSKAKGIR